MIKNIHYILLIILILPGVDALAKPKNVPNCAYIEHIEILDNGMINKFQLNELTQYEHRCLTENDIKTLLRSIAHLCIKEGYVTSKVYIEPKKPGEKVLRIHAVPGIVGKSNFISKGVTFNIRDVEQELDQISRLGYRAKATIAPGANPYESDIMIEAQGNRVYGYASIDNHGTKSNGVNQGEVYVQALNTLGIYDTLSLNYQYGFNSIKKKASESISSSMGVPYGYWYFKLHTSYFDYQRILPGQYSDLQYTGSNYNYTGDIERVIHRDQNSKTTATVSLALKDSSNYLKQILLSSSHKLSIVGFKLSHTRRALGGALNLSAGVQEGIRAFGAEKNMKNAPRAQFTKYLLDASYAKYLMIQEYSFILDTSLHAQTAHDKLYDSEQIGIGGIRSVRGFRETQFAGETGWYIMNNVAYTLPKLTSRDLSGDIQLYVGADYGKIRKNRLNNAAHKSISGGTVGIRNLNKPLTLELAYERPLHRTHHVRTKDLLYFKLSWAL